MARSLPTQIEAIRERFHTDYEREYTYRLAAPVELVCYHLIAIAEVDKLKPEKLPRDGTQARGCRQGTAGSGLC